MYEIYQKRVLIEIFLKRICKHRPIVTDKCVKSSPAFICHARMRACVRACVRVCVCDCKVYRGV